MVSFSRQFFLARQFSLAGLTGLALLCLCAPVLAVDGRIQGIHYDAASRHFRIDSAGNVKATVNTLNIAGHKRIIIDVDNAEIGAELPRDVQLLHDLSRQLPALKNLTVNQYAGNGRPIVRILMDIQGDPGLIHLIKNQGAHIELEFNESAMATRSSNDYAQPPSLSRYNSADYMPADTANQNTSTNTPPRPTGGDLSDTELRRALNVLNQKYENLAQENQYLKAKLTTAEQGQSASQYASQSAQQQYQEEQARLKADIDSRKAKSSTLQSQWSGLLAEKKRPDPALASKDSEIARLKTENQSLNSRLTAALSAPKATIELDAMKRTLAEMNRRYDNLTQENRTLKSSLNDQASLNATINASKAERERLTQEKQALTSEIARLKTELANQSAKNTASISDADLQTLRKQVTVAQSSLSESIRTINEQNKEIAYLRNQVGDVKSGLDASSKEQIAALQSRIDEKDISIRDLQRQLSAKTSASASVKSNPADKTAIAQLTLEKQALRGKLGALEGDLASLKAKYEQALREAAQRKNTTETVASGKADTAQQAQIASLNKQLADLRKENTGLRESLSAQPVKRTTSINKEAELDYTAAKADLSAKKVESALGKFKEALLLDPDNSKYAIDYSIALAEDRQYADSIDVLRRYLQRNPGDRDAYNQLGKVYLLNDQPDAANQAFSRAIPVSVLNNYATALKKLDKTGDAESVFKLALSINPKDSEVLFNLGNLYNGENKLEEARNKYLEALQIRPDFAEAHYNLGLVFSKMGNNNQAVTHLEKFLQLSPNARNAETIRAYVQKLKA